MWVARDRDGCLALYKNKPHMIEDCAWITKSDSIIWLEARMFPEVTWENSPVEAEVKIKIKK